MKYEFVEVDEDIVELRYKGKSFQSKRNIGIVKDLEDINRKAEVQFLIDLKKDGLSVKDLINERKEGNKTYLDYSNVDYLKEDYVSRKKIEFFEDFCKNITGMTLTELTKDIGLDDNECITFGYDFSQMITGMRKQDEFPSRKEK